MLETIISGVGLGIVLSFVTGPVFFALLKTSIERGFHAGMWLAAGVVTSDFIYVALAVYGSSFIQFENRYRLPIGITGSSVLMAIGCYYLLKKVRINYDNTTSAKRNTGYFLKGFLMCIFNPSLLLYWVSVTSGIISVTGEIKPGQIIPFFGSILITQFSMDTLKAYYANKLRYKIKENTITLLNRVAGALIIIFALKLIYNLVFNMPLV
ncbi:LysE family translocator [Arcticibacter sp. MXS-1]|uniref:LysE family translocator n=1 Tax=Arcticibacter sp. MXS-1 TaxID=3341726 RepID=UPI0035A926E3